MPNLDETAQWEAGIYQLETTDPVVGGAEGVDNLPHKLLANRTLYLKTKVGLGALVAGDLLVAQDAETLIRLPAVASGQVLVSQGVSQLPAFTANPAVSSIALGTNPATTGGLRLANDNAGAVTARNYLNTANITLIKLNVSNQVELGNGSAAILANGQIVGLNGSVSAPAFSFSADPNTGLYRIASATLGFVTGGVVALRLESSGAVTVGNARAGTVAGTINMPNNKAIYWTSPDGSQLDPMLWVDASGVLFLGGTDRLRITAAGNFGIDCVPAEKLTVEGGHLGINSANSLRLYIAANTLYGYFQTAGTPGNVITYFDSNDATARFQFQRQVGIKVAAGYDLHLANDSAAKPSTSTWTVASDERMKQDIELADLARCYEIVTLLPLKRFAWRDEVYTDEQVPDRHKLGWIAQDVLPILPKAVSPHKVKCANGTEIPDCLSLDADQIYAVMYGALKEMQRRLAALEQRV